MFFPIFSPLSRLFLIGVFGSKTYLAQVDRSTQKPRGRHLARPHRPFGGPLAIILNFAGSAALQHCRQWVSAPGTASDSLSKRLWGISRHLFLFYPVYICLTDAFMHNFLLVFNTFHLVCFDTFPMSWVFNTARRSRFSLSCDVLMRVITKTTTRKVERPQFTKIFFCP